MENLGNSSVRYGVGLFRNNDDIASAKGHFVHVYVDRTSRKSAAVPADMRAALQQEAESKLDESGEELLPKRTGFTRFVPPRNGRALIGYYFAIASLIPILGVVLGPIAVFNGVEGIRHARRFPEHGGGAHGIVAVTLGSMTTVANLLGLCLWPIAILQ